MWPFSVRRSDDSPETRAILIEQIRFLSRQVETAQRERDFYRDKLLGSMGVVDATYPPLLSPTEGLRRMEEPAGGKTVLGEGEQFVTVGSLRARAELKSRAEANELARAKSPVQRSQR